MKDDNWCQNLFNLLVCLFIDPNPNSYGNLSNINLDLKVSRKVKFSANDQDRLKLRVFTGVF